MSGSPARAPGALAGLAGLVLGATAGGLVLGLVYGPKDGLLMGLFLVASGLPVVAAAHLLARNRGAAGSLGRQLGAGVAVTVALLALGVGAVALLMFLSPHDALTMGVLLVFAGGLAAYAVGVLSGGVLADIHAIRDGLRAVGTAAATWPSAPGGATSWPSWPSRPTR